MSEPRQPRFIPNEPRPGQPYDGYQPSPGYQQSPGQPPFGYPQAPGGPQSPPQPPPRKKRHWLRNSFLGLVALIVIIIIASVASGGGSSTKSPSIAASPDSTGAAQKASSPAATHPAATHPAAAFQAQTLLSNSGSSQYTTAKYTVGSNGDYDIYWTYGEGSMGTSVNFQIYGDGGSDFNVNDPNQLGPGGSGVVHVYNDAGTHYLEINSEGTWTVKVVTAP